MLRAEFMSCPGRSGWPFLEVGLYREAEKGAVAVMRKSIYSTPESGVTVVGIPARNEADTIAAVAHAADLGLRLACPGGDNLIVLADNGSTDRTPERFLAAATHAPRQVVCSPAANTGKGTNVLALVHKALEVRADRLILLDADLRSAQPEWIGHLAAAVYGPAPTMAVPVYRRNRYEANTTNHLARPLVAGLFGRHLAQPIGGEFALNRALLERVVEWPVPGSALLYGIDVWLTTNSVREGYQVAEVSLGRKLHNSPFPKILHLPQQVLDSLFHVAVRAGQPDPASLDTAAAQHAVDIEAVPQDPALVGQVGATVRGYLDAHQPVIRRMFPTVAGLPTAPWGVRIRTQDWPVLLANSIQALAGGQFQAARDHLIALYINRVLSFFEEIEQLNDSETNALLDRQTRHTAKAISERSVTFAPDTAPQTFDRGYWTGIG
jgi:hypothetical protein